MPLQIECFGVAPVQWRRRNTVLFEETFQRSLANSRKIILMIELQHRFDLLDKFVVESDIAEIALLCGADGSLPSLRSKKLMAQPATVSLRRFLSASQADPDFMRRANRCARVRP